MQTSEPTSICEAKVAYVKKNYVHDLPSFGW